MEDLDRKHTLKRAAHPRRRCAKEGVGRLGALVASISRSTSAARGSAGESEPGEPP